MHYEHLPSAFPTERSKVAFMVFHLTGRAKAWATAEWSRGSSICDSLKDFIDSLRGVFDPISPDRDKARALSNIRQGTDPVCDYAIRFRTLATDSGWNSAALYDVFLRGLSDPIQDLLVPLDSPATLDSLINLAIRTDNCLQERKRSLRTPDLCGIIYPLTESFTPPSSGSSAEDTSGDGGTHAAGTD